MKKKLTVLVLLAAAAVGAWQVFGGGDADLADAGDSGQRTALYRSCVVEVIGRDDAGEGIWHGLGIVVAPDEIAAPYHGLERCASIMVQPLCCDAIEVGAIVGGGLEAEALILRAPLGSINAKFAITPALRRTDPLAEGARIWGGSRPIRIGEGGVTEGFMVAAFSPEPSQRVQYAGRGAQIAAPWQLQLMGLGAPVFDEADQLAGMVTGWGGYEVSLAVPVERLSAAPRFEPMPVAQYAARPLDVAEEAARARELGSELRQQKQFAAAIEPLRQAVQLDPSDWEAWYLLGVCLDLQPEGAAAEGEAPESARALAESVAIEPQWAEGLYSLGLTLHRMGEDRAARHYYQRAAEQAPQNPDILNNLGGSLANAGDFAAAIEWLQRAVEVAPDREQFQDNLASTQRNLERVKAGLAQAGRAADADAMIKRAQRQWQIGETRAAFDTLREAEDAAADAGSFVLARAARLLYLIDLGKYDQAQRLAEQTQEELEGHPMAGDVVRFVTGQIALAKGDLSSLLEAGGGN